MRSRPSRSALMAVALLLLACLSLPSSPPHSPVALYGSGGVGVLFAHASPGLPLCAYLSDLTNYGVNTGFFANGGTYYLGSLYFCADTAPEQYRCKCSLTQTCKKQADPWGRNIGECACCAGWMVACFVLLGLFFLVAILCGLYVLVFQGRWWCDGYVMPSTSLMPRRGPAVSCPPTRPLPDNLFRGYMSSDFVNVEPQQPLPEAYAARNSATSVAHHAESEEGPSGSAFAAAAANNDNRASLASNQRSTLLDREL